MKREQSWGNTLSEAFDYAHLGATQTHLCWCISLLNVLTIKDESDTVLAHTLSITISTHKLLQSGVFLQLEVDDSSILRE